MGKGQRAKTTTEKTEIFAVSRKARRKEERQSRKKQKLAAHTQEKKQPSTSTSTSQQTANNDKNQSKPSSLDSSSSDNKKPNHPISNSSSKQQRKNDPASSAKAKSPSPSSSSKYANLDPALAAQLERDDQEIEALEAKLGLARGKSGRSRLNKEFGKEGFGDDFGDFLADLDSVMDRLSSSSSSSRKHPSSSNSGKRQRQQAFEDEDDSSEPSSYEEGREEDDNHVDDYDDDEVDEEIVPMKEPAFDLDDEDDESVTMEELEKKKVSASQLRDDSDDYDDDDASGDSSSNEDDDHDDVDSSQSDDNDGGGDTGGGGGTGSSSSSSSDSDDDDDTKDHDKAYTYHPTKGQDIYGNTLETSTSDRAPRKYVPPHMRSKSNKSTSSSSSFNSSSVNLQEIERALNRALNRLSEDTLVPTSQSIAKLYSSFPTFDVNECIWKNAQSVCVTSAASMMMTALIPVYVAALAGAHILRGDSAQLAEYLTEQVVVALWKELEAARGDEADAGSSSSAAGGGADGSSSNKAPGNLVLLLCYLYNYDIVHCSLVYDIVRHLIEKYQEIDVELLLLILSHCGRALRSDDPTALKEIVLSVLQKRGLVDTTKQQDNTNNHNNNNNNSVSFSSRADYMISAMTDLKNNKRRKQDIVYAEKTAKLRKDLGQIKSGVAASTGAAVRASNSSLRISLQDILNAETKGRWWKVGASWIGNQFGYQDGSGKEHDPAGPADGDPASGVTEALPSSEVDEKLLKLAAKYRMNTDMRRSIFCIIMGSADCDDAFEKLVRGGMLKSRNEKETVRVLLECCGGEKSYNKFYSHLASRICEFQPQCKFSFQLAYWDVFKQFESLKVRKAANLAKLLFHLVVVHRLLKLNVLKTIDMSSPSDLPETAMTFLIIFFSSLLNHFDDPAGVAELFHWGISRKTPRAVDFSSDAGDDELERMSESEALQANLMVFFVQVLKSSPDYKKGSNFLRNLKVAIKACDVDNFF